MTLMIMHEDLRFRAYMDDDQDASVLTKVAR